MISPGNPPARVPISPFADATLELARILNLPIIAEGSPALTRQVNEMVVLPEALQAGFSLLPKQAEAVATFLTQGGSLFGPIGVGHGKTGITLLCAALASERYHMTRTLLVVPNKLCPQLLNNNIPWWRRHCRLNTAFWSFYSKDPKERQRLVMLRQPGCYIMPYSTLSNRDTDEILEALKPELWIFDECHHLQDKGSARAGRVLRHIRESGAKTVMLSGTITNRHLTDYYHLAVTTLGPWRVPMPNDYPTLKQWDIVLGSERNGSYQDSAYVTDQAIRLCSPLVTWARSHFPEIELPPGIDGIRRAYRLRLITVPGVVSTSDDEIGVSLIISTDDTKTEQPNARLVELRKQVDVLMKAPDGTELAHAMHKWLYFWELSGGIYYEHEWPASATPEQIQTAETHLKALNEYRKVLRAWLRDRRRPGLDTPFLVGQSIKRHGDKEVDDPLLVAWWKEEHRLRALVEIRAIEKGIRVCDSRVRQIVRLIKDRPLDGEGVLVWYYHNELGKWLSEELHKVYGDQVVHCPAGEVYDALIIDPKLRKSIVVASMEAHHEGKDLQFLGQSILAQLPKTAKAFQQVLGRTHRRGQERDDVHAVVALQDEWEHAHLWNLLLDATYQNSTTPQRQKLLAAEWVGAVRQFPDSYLVERGLEVAGLSARERQLLSDRFAVSLAG